MVLSIIIVNWNVRDLLRKCLASIGTQMLLGSDEYETIVIDNASTDGSVEMLRGEFPGIAVIESKVNLGFGAGCNKALHLAKGEFVLLLNPDTELIDHAVDGMLEIMRERRRAAIVAARLVNAELTFQSASGGALPTLANVAWNYLFLRYFLPRSLAPSPLFLDGDSRELMRIEWVSGAAMLLRREAIGERIFDESFFMFGEDLDLCDRMGRAGWEVLYSGRHSVLHHQGKSFEQQGSLELRASAHDGPRSVFKRDRGALSVLAYDAILFAGFLVRWPLYGFLSRVRPGRGYAARCEFSRKYVRAMLHRRPSHPVT